MATERVDHTVVTEGPAATAGPEPVQTIAGRGQVPTIASRETVRTFYQRTTTSPSGSEMLRRVVVGGRAVKLA